MSDLRVWKRLEVTKSDGEILKLRIQDAGPEHKRDIIDFMAKHYVGQETMQKACGTHNNEDATQEFCELWYSYCAQEQLVVCCPDDENGLPLIGVSAMTLQSEGQESADLKKIMSQVKTPEVLKFLEVIVFLRKWCSGIKELGVNKYYYDLGIGVHSEYRKLGIAGEFLKLRREICREHKVPATGGYMTAIGTQKAAQNNGWRTLREISFAELTRIFGVVFEGPPMLKYMVAEKNLSK